jgi:hypothetical protein
MIVWPKGSLILVANLAFSLQVGSRNANNGPSGAQAGPRSANGRESTHPFAGSE